MKNKNKAISLAAIYKGEQSLKGIDVIERKFSDNVGNFDCLCFPRVQRMTLVLGVDAEKGWKSARRLLDQYRPRTKAPCKCCGRIYTIDEELYEKTAPGTNYALVITITVELITP